jgi:hypothetical protein
MGSLVLAVGVRVGVGVEVEFDALLRLIQTTAFIVDANSIQNVLGVEVTEGRE